MNTLTAPSAYATELIQGQALLSAEGPKYKAEIATSAKGFHSFTIKAFGDDLDAVLAEVQKASDKLGEYCNAKNEGVA